MRAIAYARVSTDQQGAEGLGMEAQRRQLREEIARRGWELVDVESDVASGSKTNGGLQRAMERIEAGEAGALVVTKLDRLARSTLNFADILARAGRAGWALVICELSLDTSSPMGAFTAHVIAAVAELERAMISQRTKAALDERRRQGVKLGRTKGFLESPPETIALIKELRTRKLMSLREICRELDRRGVRSPQGRAWNPESVRRAVLAD